MSVLNRLTFFLKVRRCINAHCRVTFLRRPQIWIPEIEYYQKMLRSNHRELAVLGTDDFRDSTT